MKLNIAHDGGGGLTAPFLAGGLEISFGRLTDERSEHLVDSPTVAVEVGENDRPFGAAKITTGRAKVRFCLVEKAPETGDPRGPALIEIVGFLFGRTTVEVGLDQTIELARCQDRPVGAGNGFLLRQTKQELHEEAFRMGTAPSELARSTPDVVIQCRLRDPHWTPLGCLSAPVACG